MNKAEDLPAATAARADAGLTFIEVLIALVLIGTAVVGVLTAMRATIIASRIERDHSAAQQWLQSAIQELEKPGIYKGCNLLEPTVRAAYDIEIDKAAPPPGWAPSQISIVAPINFWDGDRYNPGSDPASCRDNDGFLLQLITIRVVNEDGSIVEESSVVIGDD